jgi:hypothetical protein
MTRGDLIHIPQDTLLLGQRDTKGLTKGTPYFLKVEKPSRAIFWSLDMRKPNWASIYFKERIWDVRLKDIYPITQEKENAS